MPIAKTAQNIIRDKMKYKETFNNEAEFQAQCNHLLRDLESCGQLKFYHIEKGGHNKQRSRRKDIPDLIIWPKDSNCFFIELKQTKKIPSDDQFKWGDDIRTLGYHWYFTDSWDGFIKILKYEKIIG